MTKGYYMDINDRTMNDELKNQDMRLNYVELHQQIYEI